MHYKVQLSSHASRAFQIIHAVYANHGIHATWVVHTVMLSCNLPGRVLTPHTLNYFKYMLAWVNESLVAATSEEYYI